MVRVNGIMEVDGQKTIRFLPNIALVITCPIDEQGTKALCCLIESLASFPSLHKWPEDNHNLPQMMPLKLLQWHRWPQPQNLGKASRTPKVRDQICGPKRARKRMEKDGKEH